MDLGILHLPHNLLYHLADGVLVPELDSGGQVCLVLAVKLQLASAHRLHVVDVDGLAASYNGLVAQGIRRRLVGGAHVLQLLGSMADSDGNRHLQNPSGLLADIVQQAGKIRLGIVAVNGGNNRDPHGGIEYGKPVKVF